MGGRGEGGEGGTLVLNAHHIKPQCLKVTVFHKGAHLKETSDAS